MHIKNIPCLFMLVSLILILLSCPDSTTLPPEIEPQGRVFRENIEITISCVDSSAVIYYTIDGTTPTADSLIYRNPIQLTGNGTRIQLRASAKKLGGAMSELNEEFFAVKYPIKRWLLYSSGPDGLWYSPDDEIRSYYEMQYNENYDPVLYSMYYPGSDNELFTSDDELMEYRRFEYDDQNRCTRYFNCWDPGEDDIWFTTDDMISGYQDVDCLEDGRWKREIYFRSGDDGKAFTQDDERYSFTLHEYGNGVEPDRAVTYGKGPDSELFTPDDEINSYLQKDNDLYGILTEETLVFNCGDDGTWFTPDDLAYYHIVYIYKESTNTEVMNLYGSSGSDGEWNTRDDILDGYYIGEF